MTSGARFLPLHREDESLTLRLHTIICSTRPGRIGPSIARWFHETATGHSAFVAELVDLAAFNLPVYDEPVHPRLRNYRHEHTKAWSRSVEAADAFVFVTPEYNHNPAASFVNALNYVYSEWHYKPVGFISYGGMSGGLRAAHVERLLVATLKMVPILEAVSIQNVAKHLDESKVFAPEPHHITAADAMLGELARWASALKTMRVPSA
jgi:NAD(P)H-dependent FMN reductase